MNRREFVTGVVASAAFAPLAGLAQQAGRTYRVGAIFGGGAASMSRYRSALVEQLATHGFIEGRNLVIEARAGAEIFDLDRTKASELTVVGVTPGQIYEARSLSEASHKAAARIGIGHGLGYRILGRAAQCRNKGRH